MNSTTTPITPELIAAASSYEEYRKFSQELVAAGKTTWPEAEAEMYKRMIRVTGKCINQMVEAETKVDLLPETREIFNELSRDYYWLVLVEPWCGDVAANLPPIETLAGLSEHIDLRIILRDEHPDVMDAFLTNGGRSIPKLVCLDKKNLTAKWSWGPRPEKAQEMVLTYKANPNKPYKEFVADMRAWYEADVAHQLQREIIALMKQHT